MDGNQGNIRSPNFTFFNPAGVLSSGPSSRTISDSPSSFTTQNLTPIDPATPSSSRQQPEVQMSSHEDESQKRRGRKGHTKSRRGCYNCKRARIKCKENRPSCDYCAHRNMVCQYPDLQISQHTSSTPSQSGVMIRSPLPSTSSYSNPTYSQLQYPQPPQAPLSFQLDHALPVFTIHDFRLFNHFISSAHPQHPVGNASVWTHEIPNLASDHDFLLHSMLALSASELGNVEGIQTPPELQQTALTHRVKAITSLNRAIAEPLVNVSKDNAMLACCFVLLYQSVLFEDGLIEYMTFLRGIIAVSIHMGINKVKFVFENMFNQEEIVQEGLRGCPLIRPDLAREACRSLEEIGCLIERPKEVEYYTHLLSAARDLFTSSTDAYGHISKIYGLFSYFMSHADFATFIDPTNEAGKVLMAHFSALQLIMAPIFVVHDTKTSGTTRPSSWKWLRWCHLRMTVGMERYYRWTMEIERGMREGTIPLKFGEPEPCFSDGGLGEENLEVVERGQHFADILADLHDHSMAWGTDEP